MTIDGAAHRFRAFVIGNTWAWPKSDPPTQLFSRLLGGPVGRRLILNRNLFVEGPLGRGTRRPRSHAGSKCKSCCGARRQKFTPGRRSR